MEIRSREQNLAPKKHFICPRLAQAFAIAARRADRQGSAAVQSRRNDNLYTGLVRPVFWAAIFQRVAARQNEADRPVDDELHETVREAA